MALKSANVGNKFQHELHHDVLRSLRWTLNRQKKRSIMCIIETLNLNFHEKIALSTAICASLSEALMRANSITTERALLLN